MDYFYLSADGKECEQVKCGDQAILQTDGKTCLCPDPLIMAGTGNCIAIPNYVGSISGCGGEFIGGKMYGDLT